MLIEDARIKLDVFGKPIIIFEAIPETDLEEDALKAMGFHIENNKDGVEAKVNIPAPPSGDKKSYLISTFWQVGK